MTKVKPGLPQGTRDFGPEVVRKRNYIFNTIKNVFERYGFLPLETPAMENLDTLMGKYGEEGNKLIFKILNNGLDNPAKQQNARDEFEKILQGKNSESITERALKYDLTIPFARYVAMNHSRLVFPFKRYQIQPVWRADRPARGRYREFYQCDADVVGSNSLLNEVDLVNLYRDVFKALGLDVEIKINNRKILAGLANLVGGSTMMNELAAAIDKLDKIGPEKVKEELLQKGMNAEQVSTIEKYLSISGTNEEKLGSAKELFVNQPIGLSGIEELEYVLDYLPQAGLQTDFTLARGLNYYTGIIFEVKAKAVNMGSIGGGGRYDDLTGLFGVPGIPGVGISFGVDRIYDVLEEKSLFPSELDISTQVLFFNLGQAESKAASAVMQELRSQNIRAELYHENSKFEKQFKYAEKKNIPYVVIIGEEEMANGKFKLKDLGTGEQSVLSLDELRKKFSH